MPDGEGQVEQAPAAAEILAFWQNVEALHIPEAPEPGEERRNGRLFRSIRSLRPEAALPWELGHSGSLRSTHHIALTHRVYVGVRSHAVWSEVIESVIATGRNPESKTYREPTGKETKRGYLACFDVTDEGLFRHSSYTAAGFSGALARFREGARHLDLGAKSASAQHDFDGRLAARSARHALGVDGRSSPAVTWEDLLEEARIAHEPLGELLRHEDVEIIVQSTAHRRQQQPAPEEAPELACSPYLDDLGRVTSAALGPQGLSAALTRYLGPPTTEIERSDVLHDTAALIECLDPSLLLRGRWPAPADQPLLLAQQAAVGRIMADLRSQGLIAVNGPPGTGKTTILRDIIADVVVRRARTIASCDDPCKLFLPPIPLGEDEFYPLHKDVVAGSAIVVASSNNSAVENISKELPARRAIGAGYGEPSYWGGVARRLFEEFELEATEPWGLLAAPLGRAANRNKVAAALRGGNTTKSPPGLLDALASPDALSMRHWRECRLEFLALSTQVEDFVKHYRELDGRSRKLPEYCRALVEAEALRLAREDELGAERSRAAVERSRARERLAAARAAAELARARRAAAEAKREQALEQLALTRTALRPPLWVRILDALGMERPEARIWRLRVAEGREREAAADREAKAARREHEQSEEMQRRCEQEVENHEQRHQAALAGLESEASSAREASRRAAEQLSTCRDELVRARRDMGLIPRWDIADGRIGERQQRASAWVSPAFDELRSKLFLSALRLHELTLLVCHPQARANVRAVIELIENPASARVPAGALCRLWEFFFFVIPVASTTFAAFGRTFAGLGPEALGWVLIDEAGQATCHAMVGALWRARRAVVVGDPLQVEPVLTVSPAVVQALQDLAAVGHEWSPLESSGQALADRVSHYGTSVNSATQDRIWTGFPLRAHRRCGEPMFKIANRIAYGGQMVQAVPPPAAAPGNPSSRPGRDQALWSPLGESCWFDIVSSGPATRQVVREEMKELRRLLQCLEKNWPTRASGEPATVFVISPFRRVASAASECVPESLAHERGHLLDIGTIHKFQGKEADIVILVLGSAPGAEGAGRRRWASSKPNILNVAVTRAKQRLHVIGHRSEWARCPHFDVLAEMLETAPSRVASPTAAMP